MRSTLQIDGEFTSFEAVPVCTTCNWRKCTNILWTFICLPYIYHHIIVYIRFAIYRKSHCVAVFNKKKRKEEDSVNEKIMTQPGLLSALHSLSKTGEIASIEYLLRSRLWTYTELPEHLLWQFFICCDTVTLVDNIFSFSIQRIYIIRGFFSGTQVHRHNEIRN